MNEPDEFENESMSDCITNAFKTAVRTEKTVQFPSNSTCRVVCFIALERRTADNTAHYLLRCSCVVYGCAWFLMVLALALYERRLFYVYGVY
jgi:hypothetical protein